LNKLPTDPWGRPYEYNYPGQDAPYDLVSYGADHQEGGTGADADLTNTDIEVASGEQTLR
jgi:general secretion pathway protein G